MLVLAGSYKAQIGLILLVGALGYVKYTAIQTRCVGIKLYGQVSVIQVLLEVQEKLSSSYVSVASRRGLPNFSRTYGTSQA